MKMPEELGRNQMFLVATLSEWPLPWGLFVCTVSAVNAIAGPVERYPPQLIHSLSMSVFQPLKQHLKQTSYIQLFNSKTTPACSPFSSFDTSPETVLQIKARLQKHKAKVLTLWRSKFFCGWTPASMPVRSISKEMVTKAIFMVTL